MSFAERVLWILNCPGKPTRIATYDFVPNYVREPRVKRGMPWIELNRQLPRIFHITSDFTRSDADRTRDEPATRFRITLHSGTSTRGGTRASAPVSADIRACRIEHCLSSGRVLPNEQSAHSVRIDLDAEPRSI